MDSHAPTRSREKGFTLLELMIVVAIMGLLAATALPVYRNALIKANKTALVADMNSLYKAFLSYRFDHDRFPSDSGAGALNTRTLEPLASGGYFTSATSLNRKLLNGRIQVYWAPDWDGHDADFVVVAQSAIDRNMVIYAMSYDFGGWIGYDGVYVLEDGTFVRADQAI
jgi:prepilin-type N-terminal cleavage/methylation domain-containing protein